jgi:signal transduction histidine kinase
MGWAFTVGIAQFITDNMEAILTEWEAFAKSLPPGQAMSSAALRDDAERMLRFVAADMASAQSEDERAVKGHGQQAAGSEDTAAQTHGRLRLTQAFDLAEMVSEFRALRASVIRLWSAQSGADLSSPSSELIRFNEAIDQILAESLHRYARDMERARELLLAVLGHDLRNPLSSIRMSAEVLARTPLTPRQNELTGGIIRGSERMRQMIHDLLDFTRTRLGAKLVVTAQRCDLSDVCRSIADETRSGHPDREVSVESSGDCVGQWDGARMAQLVSNLLGNAVQHGHQKTPVKIITVGDDPAVVTLSVGNQGPAIPPERYFSIFDPLNRSPAATDHAQAGSLGLGLYIAREIALAHGGSIRVLSSDGAGTFFEARLPRIAAVAQ